MDTLLTLDPIKKFIEAVEPKAMRYFGGDNASIVYLQPDGTFYGVALYEWLSKKKKNLTLATMTDDGEGLDEKKVKGRKVLIVDNDIITGKGYKRSMEAMRIKKQRLGIKAIKFAVYSDRIGLADFSVGQYAAEAIWRMALIDALDLKIMKYLIQDGRKSYADIGKEVHLSAVAVSDRVEKLFKGGAFQIKGGFTIDQFYKMSAHIQISAGREIIEKLVEGLEHASEVYHLIKVSGRQTLEVSILIRNLEHVEEFIETRIHAVPGVKNITVVIGELPILPKIYFPSV